MSAECRARAFMAKCAPVGVVAKGCGLCATCFAFFDYYFEFLVNILHGRQRFWAAYLLLFVLFSVVVHRCSSSCALNITSCASAAFTVRRSSLALSDSFFSVMAFSDMSFFCSSATKRNASAISSR